MKPENVIPEAEKLIIIYKDLLRPSRWKTLTNKQKRKAILLDAMKQVLNNGYTPASSYIDEDLYSYDNKSLKTVLKKHEGCKVCQRGMLLLSCVRFNNILTTNDYFAFWIGTCEDIAEVYKFFQKDELLEMENNFENPWNPKKSKSKFYRKYYIGSNRRVLSIAIFLNAYKYGVFSPNKWTNHRINH